METCYAHGFHHPLDQSMRRSDARPAHYMDIKAPCEHRKASAVSRSLSTMLVSHLVLIAIADNTSEGRAARFSSYTERAQLWRATGRFKGKAASATWPSRAAAPRRR
eukprot:3680819-Prymnesium_polylepis.2